jgi:cell fate regulator YaaT (PSP1 superfamily)
MYEKSVTASATSPPPSAAVASPTSTFRLKSLDKSSSAAIGCALSLNESLSGGCDPSDLHLHHHLHHPQSIMNSSCSSPSLEDTRNPIISFEEQQDRVGQSLSASLASISLECNIKSHLAEKACANPSEESSWKVVGSSPRKASLSIAGALQAEQPSTGQASSSPAPAPAAVHIARGRASSVLEPSLFSVWDSTEVDSSTASGTSNWLVDLPSLAGGACCSAKKNEPAEISPLPFRSRSKSQSFSTASSLLDSSLMMFNVHIPIFDVASCSTALKSLESESSPSSLQAQQSKDDSGICFGSPTGSASLSSSCSSYSFETSPGVETQLMHSKKSSSSSSFGQQLKNFQFSSYRGQLYLVEFKSGRTEVMYVQEVNGGQPEFAIAIGNYIIVEADRGEDLGKVVGEISIDRLKAIMNNDCYSVGESGNGSLQLSQSEIYAGIGQKEIIPKRIHRLARPADVRLLQSKAQEEAIAMLRCQSKVRQKKLPMEVVDAEYQWDRNKLTFYFIADRRIDFRELVRDLFRIYKTRIWMCAVEKNRIKLLTSGEHQSACLALAAAAGEHSQHFDEHD